MARICPETGFLVPYAVCLECDDRGDCRNGFRNKNNASEQTERRSDETLHHCLRHTDTGRGSR